MNNQNSFVLGGSFRPVGFGTRSIFTSGSGLGQGEVGDLFSGIGEGLGKLPEDVADDLRDRLRNCEMQLASGGLTGLVTGIQCLRDLYSDVRAAVKAFEEGEEITPPKREVTQEEPEKKPEPGTSPLLLLGGLAAVGGLGYLAAKYW